MNSGYSICVAYIYKFTHYQISQMDQDAVSPNKLFRGIETRKGLTTMTGRNNRLLDQDNGDCGERSSN